MSIEHGPRLSYGIKDVVEATGIGRSKIYQEIAAGRLPVLKVGSRTLIAADDLTAWLESHRKNAA